ncbi:aminotransferase class V-fold PLP-dependent enzyme [Arcanobacterium hippocoleae]
MEIDALFPRNDFPLLQREMSGSNRLVYLDSAATAQLPSSVINAIAKHLTQHNGAVNRGRISWLQKLLRSANLPVRGWQILLV